MSMESSCPSYSLVSTCSGNGICDEASHTCICHQGWSSVGDFSTNEKGFCHIHIQTIRIIWVVASLPASMLLFIVLCNMARLHEIMKSKKRMGYIPMMILCFILLSMVGFIILGILKIVDPVKYSIGVNFLVTAVFTFCFTNVSCSVCSFLILLTQFLQKQTRVMSRKSKSVVQKQNDFVIKLAYTLMILSPAGSSFPFWSVHESEHVLDSLYALVGICTIGSITLTALIIQALRMIVFDLEIVLNNKTLGSSRSLTNADNNMLKGLSDSLKAYKKYISICCPILCIPFIVVISWKLLAINTSYLWPITITAINYISYLATQTFSKKVSSSGSQLESKETKGNIQISMALIKRAVLKVHIMSSPKKQEESKRLNADQLVDESKEVAPAC